MPNELGKRFVARDALQKYVYLFSIAKEITMNRTYCQNTAVLNFIYFDANALKLLICLFFYVSVFLSFFLLYTVSIIILFI